MTDNDKTTSPSSKDANDSNTSPSNQNQNKPTKPSTPISKAEAAQDGFNLIDDDDLAFSDPEMMDHSDAHEEPVLVEKQGIPRPDELEGNAEASARGGKQPTQRSFGAMTSDFERQHGKLLSNKDKRSVRKKAKQAELEEAPSADGGEDVRESKQKKE